MASLSGRGLLCAVGAGAFIASSASAVVIQGSWTQEADLFVLPGASSTAAVHGFLVDAIDLFDAGTTKAAALAGHQPAQPARITYQTYPSDSSWHGAQGMLGELVITLRFNPLATGGAQDITTGGEYIDKQLAKQQKNAEFAQVDVDKEVWRQDFGQVKADRHEVRGNEETFTFSFRGLVDLPPGALDVDAFGHTEAFTIDFSVVAVPTPAAWVGIATLGVGALRRKR